MRDWNTPPPSGGFPAPAEGLPPCLSMAIFEGRVVTFHDRSCEAARAPDRFAVAWGKPKHWDKDPSVAHGDCPPMPVGGVVEKLLTDDPAEARAAFERGAEWVRTGVGP